MVDSYLVQFKNKDHRKDFELDVWRVENFIKTQTGLTQYCREIAPTCKILDMLKEEDC